MVSSMLLIAVSLVMVCVLAINRQNTRGPIRAPVNQVVKNNNAKHIPTRVVKPAKKQAPMHPNVNESLNAPLNQYNSNCYGDVTNLMIVTFCTDNASKFCGGKCAGGVYPGVLKCNLDSERACQAKLGVNLDESKDVVVKFNHSRRGNGKDAIMNRLEIERMRQLAGNRHVVQLYGLIGMNSEASEQLVNGKKLIMPGMVMEYLPGKSLDAYFDEFFSRKIKIEQVVREFPCMMEQTAMAVYAMISKGFVHTDLNHGNMVRTGEQYRSVTTGVTCPLIKVIDFGLTESVKADDPQYVAALSKYAQIMDELVHDYVKNATSEQMKLQLKQMIPPSQTTVEMFKKIIATGSPTPDGPKIISATCKHHAETMNSYCNTLLQLVNPPPMPRKVRRKPAGLIPIAGKPACYKEETGEFSVEFCTDKCFKEGDCAGGVFRGTLVCTLASNDCRRKFGVDRLVVQDVVVKFNENGSQRDRNVFERGKLVRQLPATDTKKEIAAMQALSSEEHVVKLYGLLATRSKTTTVQLGSKTFLTPGMVMEFLPGGSVATALRKYNVSEDELACILEQATRAALAMIKKGFIHVDMHLGNLVLTKSTYSSAATQCPFVKVIDFGYIEQPRSRVHPQLELLAIFAVAMDRKYSVPGLSSNTVIMLSDFLNNLVQKGKKEAARALIQGHCRTGKAFCNALLDLTRRNL